MIEPTITPPDGWSRASDTMPSAEQTYVYHVGDGEHVPLGLEPLFDNTDEIRLKISSIEEVATVQFPKKLEEPVFL